MQLFPIFLVATVLVAAGGLTVDWNGDGPGPVAVLAAAWAPIGVILSALGAAIWFCCRRMDRGEGSGLILTAERLARWSRWLIVVNHGVAVIVFGWLDTVRDVVRDPVLLDEVITMLPPIIGLLGTWWIQYPVERRLRDALVIRQLDNGQPVYQTPSRWRWVSMQSRLGLFLLLTPLLIIIALAEIIHWGGSLLPDSAAARWAADGATLAAALAVFLCTPLIARWLLHLAPLGEGELRNDMLEICRRHEVSVREVLLWRTSGSMINAAVMGLLGPLRYVLLTDVLLETLSRREVQAVMAHEIGHVRRHHIPWLLASLLAAIAVAEFVIEGPLYILQRAGVTWPDRAGAWLGPGATILAFLAALQIFGWVSRRFERQADTFAVQHLSSGPPVKTAADDTATGRESPAAERPSEQTGGETETVSAEAAAALQNALSRIAHLNAIDPRRRSWRHGSIASRQRYLHSIVGRPLTDLPIDRTVRRIKIATVTVLLAAACIAAIDAAGAAG